MNWDKLLCRERFGISLNTVSSEYRSEFQRDYDRIIFSPEFRKLQSKTQVFPLPESIFIHNRLTHSLEVSCIGRSIAQLAVDAMLKQHFSDNKYLGEIPAIVSTACLAHDIGNPPFGHSGENAISSYFANGEGAKFENHFNEQEWKVICNFEGNANLLRLLTHQFNGRRKGGFALTFASLGAMIKYPYSAMGEKKKYGYFISENDTFNLIVEKCGLKVNNEIKRHPLVFIVEAADDISYLIMDIEDANQLNVISEETVIEYLFPFITNDNEIEFKFEKQSKILSKKEKIKYLRSLVINVLVKSCSQVFIENYKAVINGEFNSSLTSCMPENIKVALENCKKLGLETIYCDPSVTELEIAGHNILTTLINSYCNAIFTPEKEYSKLLLKTVPEMYKPIGSAYEKVRLINDYISSMTDIEALRLYREIMGIDIPKRTVY